MAFPSTSKLQELAHTCVLKLDKDGKLHTLTRRLLRRDLEKKLELGEGDLDTVECRDAIENGIQSAMAETQSGQGAEEEKDEKKDEKPKTQPDSPKRKKRKLDSKTEDNLGASARLESDTRTKKGAEGKGKGAAQKRTSPLDESVKPKKLAKRKKVAQAPIVESESEQEQALTQEPVSKTTHVETPRNNTLGPESNADSSLTLGGNAQEKDTLHQSESELSVLIDEPPKPKRKAKAQKDNNEPGTKRKPRSKPSGTSSKDDETVKRLKSLVLACGVRKVWSKVFQGLDSPSQQIKKLKEILQELGMTGRMSMEQAKAIKAKRELEQELQDVKDFEKSVMGSSRLGANNESEGEGSAEADDDDDDNDPQPTRKRMNARQSIMAFLGDQSSDDD